MAPQLTVPLTGQASDTDWQARVGGKASSLFDLLHAGQKVPGGVVLTYQALTQTLTQNRCYETFQRALAQGDRDAASDLQKTIQSLVLPSQVREPVAELRAQFPDSGFAVRSSGSCEDLEGASFAGLYQTVLNVHSEDAIARAIKHCWASLLDERVWHYAQRRGVSLSQLRMAVIVQQMVRADKSGVAFSVNPLNGRDCEVLIEACFGLGEALVGGSVTPDRYTYDWYRDEQTQRHIASKEIELRPGERGGVQSVDNAASRDAPVLAPSEVRELAHRVAHIQAEWGYPVDVEWSIAKGECYTLQARPITQINFAGIREEWSTADFKDGGVSSTVCTPFMWSLYDFIWEATLPAFLQKIGLRKKNSPGVQWGRMFYGRPYWNLSRVKQAYAQLPGYIERNFDEDVGIEICYEGQGEQTRLTPRSAWRGARTLWAFERSLQRHLRALPAFKAQQQALFERLNATDITALAPHEQQSFYSEFLHRTYYRSESRYFQHIFHTSIATSLFKDFYRNCQSDVPFIALISGLQNVSHLHFNYAIWDLSRSLRRDPQTYAFWQNESTATLLACLRGDMKSHGFPQVKELLARYQYHSTRELDILVPRYGEDPSFVLRNLQQSMALDDDSDPLMTNNAQYRDYCRQRAQFLAGLPVWKRGRAERLLEQLRNILWWREELRELSTHCYFHVRQFTLALAEGFTQLGVFDTREDGFFISMHEWVALLDGELSHGTIRNRVHKNRLYYRGFQHFSNPNEIGQRFANRQEAERNADSLQGIACSPGVVEGRAKVIRDIFDAERLEPGDILITPYTDPGWTPKFSLIAAVATETGGVLSHAAVISREYGIPAVLAISGLTQAIADNDRVRIDGNRGVVERIGSSDS